MRGDVKFYKKGLDLGKGDGAPLFMLEALARLAFMALVSICVSKGSKNLKIRERS